MASQKREGGGVTGQAKGPKGVHMLSNEYAARLYGVWGNKCSFSLLPAKEEAFGKWLKAAYRK